MIGRITLHYTTAAIVAIAGAVIAVAVSFGADVSQHNIDSILTLVGLLGAGITIGGGVKTAGMIRAGLLPSGLHLTPAVIISAVGALLAVAVSFGLDLSQANIDSIMKLVGLISGGLLVGGGLSSGAMIAEGVHPKQTELTRRYGRMAG